MLSKLSLCEYSIVFYWRLAQNFDLFKTNNFLCVTGATRGCKKCQF